MLGVCLLFVGIVLINNGICNFYKVDGKSLAVMNIFTGGLSLFINFVNLVQGNYYAAGTGLLFCFTYLFVAVNNIFKLSGIPFAWFSTFVAINAVVFGTLEGFTGSTALGIQPDIRWLRSGISGRSSGEHPSLRTSWAKNSASLCRPCRYLRAS